MISFFAKKGLYIFNIFGGTSLALSLVPLSLEIVKQVSKTTLKVRKTLYPRFVLGSDDGGRELSIQAGELINKWNANDSIPFSKVVMQWGYRKLSEFDALISMCEKGTYYLARHVWDDWYRLDNGKRFKWSQDICATIKDGAKSIQINFKRKNGVSEISKLKVSLDTCGFQWSGENNDSSKKRTLNMNCKGDTSDAGAKNRKEEDVILTLSYDDYKLEYNPTKRNDDG